MNPSIYPCLWFDGKAQTAAKYYMALFPQSRMLEDHELACSFELCGCMIMALNGGPKYAVNRAVSYFVYCGKEINIDQLYEALRKDGEVVFPLDKYDWSPRYAWVQDKYGVNWQLDVEAINHPQKIVPCLLFSKDAVAKVKEALGHYLSCFPNSRALMEYPFPVQAGKAEGALLFAQLKLGDFILNLMSGMPDQGDAFSPGNSLVIACRDQSEIDAYWESLGKGGLYDMCGWLRDKYGHSWQVLPDSLGKLMHDPLRSKRVMQALLGMQKIELEKLKQA